MDTEQEELLTKIENALEKIEPWQKEVIWLDIDNEYETRNEILQREVAISTQIEITRYMQRLRNKVKELVETGEYKEKHKGNNKPTLKGF